MNFFSHLYLFTYFFKIFNNVISNTKIYIKTLLKIYKKIFSSVCGAFAGPSNRWSGLQSEEPPHNTRRFKDYCLLYPTLDPTIKRKLLKVLIEAFRKKTMD